MWFIHCEKYTALVWDFDSRGGCAYVEAGNIWKISVSLTQFCSELRTALKNKAYLKKRRMNPHQTLQVTWFCPRNKHEEDKNSWIGFHISC